VIDRTLLRLQSSGSRQRAAVFVALVGGLVFCWMLLMPPGAGPDEPGHLVRSGAVARAQVENVDTYDLPDSYRLPEPGCYAFQPTVAVRCADLPPVNGETIPLASRAGEYPIWGHLAFGLPTLLPGLAPVWWARLSGALIATMLVGGALGAAWQSGRLIASSLLVGLTPMAWSTFGTVNPSTFAIAGAAALWTGLLVSDPHGRRIGSHAWLTSLGWIALALPRRDGLIWACIALALALAATDRTAVNWWRSLTSLDRLLISLSTVLAAGWGLTADSRASQAVVFAPLIVVAAEVLRWWWTQRSLTRTRRVSMSTAIAVLGAAALAALLSGRPGGWNTDLAIAVVAQTDDNLIEAIGVLGWLDTLVPWFAVFIWFALIGALVAAALFAGLRAVGWAALLLATTIVTSWVFELYQGNESGTYWQGRYSLPLLIGVPLLLSADADRAAAVASAFLRRIDRFTSIGALLILNVAAWAAARRFGVGTLGSYLPWRWDTPIQPVPPLVVLFAHAVITIALAILVAFTGRPDSAVDTDR
jgi:hypothetical protein